MTLAWSLAVAGSALVLTQSSLTKPFRGWLDKVGSANSLTPTQKDASNWMVRHLDINGDSPEVALTRVLSKLVSCSMCAGFWLGAGWAALFGERAPVALTANGFAGSVVAALAVALWLALGEAYAALGLWRYLNQPKDPKP